MGKENILRSSGRKLKEDPEKARIILLKKRRKRKTKTSRKDAHQHQSVPVPGQPKARGIRAGQPISYVFPAGAGH